MARTEPSKEAALKDVLAEVSLTDVGAMLKGWLRTMGCLGIFFAVGFLIDFASDAAGVKLPDWGIPSWVWWWVWWLLIAWMVAYEATSHRSYHSFDTSWYFPKLGWFGSLLLAAYAVGLVYLVIWVFDMGKGTEGALAYVAVWLGYVSPFTAFIAVTSHGHAKLMEKRLREVDAATPASV